MSSSLKLSFKISCTGPPLLLLLRASMDCTISIFQFEQKQQWFRKAEERTWLAEHRVETEWLSHGISHFLPGYFPRIPSGYIRVNKIFRPHSARCLQQCGSFETREIFWETGRHMRSTFLLYSNLYHLLFFVLVKYATFIFESNHEKRNSGQRLDYFVYPEYSHAVWIKIQGLIAKEFNMCVQAQPKTQICHKFFTLLQSEQILMGVRGEFVWCRSKKVSKYKTLGPG